MARTNSSMQTAKSSRPFMTVEGQENHLISLAINLAEQRLLDGTASSQEVTHFLKLGSTNARYEREKMIAENALLQAKAEQIKSQKKVEEMYSEALSAMRRYSGQDEPDEEY